MAVDVLAIGHRRRDQTPANSKAPEWLLHVDEMDDAPPFVLASEYLLAANVAQDNRLIRGLTGYVDCAPQPTKDTINHALLPNEEARIGHALSGVRGIAHCPEPRGVDERQIFWP